LRSTTAGDNDELVLANLPAEAAAVRGVIMVSQAYKGSSSSPNQLKHGLKLDGTDYWQSAKDLGLSMAAVRDILNEHPLGGSFSVDDINNVQLLLESV
jgi:predicted alpha/beta hydrolase